MGSGCIKDNSNVYFKARKAASEWNERLSSREGAAELLGIHPSTLADYELGITKFVPVDKVVLMADLYNAPELRYGYCKHECPLGKDLPLATQTGTIEGIVLRLIRIMDEEKIKEIERKLVDIAANGNIEEKDKPVLQDILKDLDEMSLAISELKLAGEKVVKE